MPATSSGRPSIQAGSRSMPNCFLSSATRCPSTCSITSAPNRNRSRAASRLRDDAADRSDGAPHPAAHSARNSLPRVRQIATTTILCVLVGLGLTYVLVYYAEVDRSGEIVLRNGTRWLEPVFRYLPTLRARTGL